MLDMRARSHALLAVTVLVIGCGPAQVSPSPSVGAVSPASSAVASASASPTESVASPSPSRSPAAGSTWHQVASLKDAAASRSGIVGFAGGYVVMRDGSRVWFSADGKTWTPVALPFKTSKDSNGIELKADAHAIASDGRQLIVVGSYTHEPCDPQQGTGGGPECIGSPISWTSTDGKAWQSSYPWPGPTVPKPYNQGSEFTTAWPVPTGGWNAAVAYFAGEAGGVGGIFHSADGLAWKALPKTPPTKLTGSPNPPELWGVGASDSTGRTVVGAAWYLSGGTGSVTRLFSTTDGNTWTPLEGFPGDGSDTIVAIPPVIGGSTSWLFGGVDKTPVPTVWSSPDLATFSAVGLPTGSQDARGSLNALIRSAQGYVATGQVSLGEQSRRASWISADGASWALLARGLETPISSDADGPDIVADGPAGVLGLTWTFDSDMPAIVWLLD